MGVTLKDIAVKAGVSRMAVSAVVNRTNSTRVSQEKRAHIARIAEEMGYMPNLTAQVLSGKSSRMVGILNASVRQYSLAVLVAQFLHNAARYKYQMLSDLYSQTRTVEEYREEVLNMLRRSPDGVIILGNPPPEVMEIIKIPNVIIQFQNDSTHRNGDLYYDHAAGGYMAGLHLLAHGHRKAVYVCSHIQNPPHDKFNGLQRAWGEAGLPDNHLQVIEAMHCEGTVEDRLLHLIHKEGYTCALMSNDFVAARALPFLRQNGIRVPEDFALIGYDGDAFVIPLNHSIFIYRFISSSFLPVQFYQTLTLSQKVFELIFYYVICHLLPPLTSIISFIFFHIKFDISRLQLKSLLLDFVFYAD